MQSTKKQRNMKLLLNKINLRKRRDPVSFSCNQEGAKKEILVIFHMIEQVLIQV